MADDTSQQSVQDNSQSSSIPVIPQSSQVQSDQAQSTTAQADFGQIPPNWPSEKEATSSSSIDQVDPTNRPDSTISADSQIIEPKSESSEIKEEAQKETPIPEVKPKDEVQLQTPSQEIGQVENQTWPNSTNLANDNLNATSSAQIDKPETPISQEANSTKLANQDTDETKPNQAETPVQTEEKPIETKEPENILQPQEAITKPIQEETEQDSLINQPQEQPQTPEIQAVKQPDNPALHPDDTDIQPPDNQAPQVQSGPSDNASTNQSEKPKEDLANFKPEPPQQPQEAPLADETKSENTQKSFGDLIQEENQPQNPPQPAIPSTDNSLSSKPFSFGDLLEESAKQTNNNIPDDLFEIKDTPQEIVQHTQPSQQDIPPVQEKPKEIIKEIIKEVPVVNQEEVTKQADEKIKSTLDQKRILANQARSNKKSKHLEKVMELARNTANISNEDIQRLLHVSQSTATNYLSQLSRNGMLKKEGIRGGTKYSI